MESDFGVTTEMPQFPKERFLAAVDAVVKANAEWVPPYGSGATFYLRPYMFASGPVIGVKPSDEYQFRISQCCHPLWYMLSNLQSIPDNIVKCLHIR